MRRTQTAPGRPGSGRRRVLAGMILVIAAAGAGNAGADSFQCERQIISVEALRAEVEAACGQPDHRENWFAGGHGPLPPTEVWTYDSGPRELIRRLRFERGRLVAITTDGYGFPRRVDPNCRPTGIVDGLSSYRLLKQCGEPLSIERIGVLAPSRPLVYPPARQPRHLQAVHRERWVYNFGPRYLMREVTLENGRVSDVEALRRGH